MKMDSYCSPLWLHLLATRSLANRHWLIPEWILYSLSESRWKGKMLSDHSFTSPPSCVIWLWNLQQSVNIISRLFLERKCVCESERELCGCVYIYEYIHVLLIALYYQVSRPQPHLASPPTSNSFERVRPGTAPGLAGLWKVPACCQDGLAPVRGDDHFGQLLVSERREERSPWVMAMVAMYGLQGPVGWGFRDHHRPHIMTGNCPECFWFQNHIHPDWTAVGCHQGPEVLGAWQRLLEVGVQAEWGGTAVPHAGSHIGCDQGSHPQPCGPLSVSLPRSH